MFLSTDNASTQRISILVYGESGVGKTTLTKTCDKPLLVSLENGYLSLKGSHIDLYDVTVDKEGNPLPMNLRFEKLCHGLELLNTDEMKAKYKWLVFDSITEIAQALVYFLQKKYPEKKDALVMWGEYNNLMTEFVKKLRDFAPYNILILGLQAMEKDDQHRRFAGIDMPGKISTRVPALFDECFQYKVFETDEGEQRRLITAPFEHCIAKDRSGKLEKFELPNIQNIYDKIHKGEE